MSRVFVEIEKKMFFLLCSESSTAPGAACVFCSLPAGSRWAPGWAQQLAVTWPLGQYCLWRCYRLLAWEPLFDVWHLLAALLYSVICAPYFSCLCMYCVSVSWIWWRQWGSSVLLHSLLAQEYLSRFIALKTVCLEWLESNPNLKKDHLYCYLSKAFCDPVSNAKEWNFAHQIQQ